METVKKINLIVLFVMASYFGTQANQETFINDLQKLASLLRHNASAYQRKGAKERITTTNQTAAVSLLGYASKLDTMVSALQQGDDNYDAQEENEAKYFLLNLKKHIVPHLLDTKSKSSAHKIITHAMETLQRDLDE